RLNRLNLMGDHGFPGQARSVVRMHASHDARCGASREGRNAPWGPSCQCTLRMTSPTAGRVCFYVKSSLHIFGDAPLRRAMRA
ncbi:MAG: hypothetical protein O6924_11015, partial [Alphaproteobacteria bacterium]|nr:hypothetical protein [Alphaproteobacteria bacterium]